ncbi:MAG: PQQ-binding-like beta-propeller repeat protein [Phycisphaerae bacterium]|nr:PQQ-binding-like beta-propeller repeat protein [Phycisphaerae bacterium]
MTNRVTFFVALGAGWLVCVAFFVARAETPPVAATTSTPTSAPTSLPSAEAARIAEWVVQLGDGRATRREQASKALADIGLPALPALRVATTHRDPEVAARASLLITSIRAAAIDDCLLWKTELPVSVWGHRDTLINDELLFLPGRNQTVFAVKRTDGSVVWEYQADHMNSPRLELAGNTLICSSSSGFCPITALDAATGKERWQTEDRYFPYDAGTTHLLVGQGDNLQTLIGLSLEDGTVAWRLDVPELFGSQYGGMHSSVLTKDAYRLTSYHGENAKSVSWGMAAVDPATGEKQWLLTGPAGPNYVRGGVGDYLYTFTPDPNTQTPAATVYSLKTGKKLEKGPYTVDVKALTGHGVLVTDKILLSTAYAGLVAYDLASGKELWRYAPYGDLDFSVKLDGRKMPVEDIKRTRAQLRASHSYAVITNITVCDGEVIFPVGDGLLALDLATGKPLWKYPAEEFVGGAMVVRDGVAYFKAGGGQLGNFRGETIIQGAEKTHLYALDLAKARQLGMP